MMMMMVMMMMVLMTMMMMMVKVITLGFASTPSLAIRVLPQVALSMGLSLDSDHLQSLGVSFVIKAASTGCLTDCLLWRKRALRWRKRALRMGGDLRPATCTYRTI